MRASTRRTSSSCRTRDIAAGPPMRRSSLPRLAPFLLRLRARSVPLYVLRVTLRASPERNVHAPLHELGVARSPVRIEDGVIVTRIRMGCFDSLPESQE